MDRVLAPQFFRRRPKVGKNLALFRSQSIRIIRVIQVLRPIRGEGSMDFLFIYFCCCSIFSRSGGAVPCVSAILNASGCVCVCVCVCVGFCNSISGEPRDVHGVDERWAACRPLSCRRQRPAALRRRPLDDGEILRRVAAVAAMNAERKRRERERERERERAIITESKWKKNGQTNQTKWPNGSKNSPKNERKWEWKECLFV